MTGGRSNQLSYRALHVYAINLLFYLFAHNEYPVLHYSKGLFLARAPPPRFELGLSGPKPDVLPITLKGNVECLVSKVLELTPQHSTFVALGAHS